MHETRFPPLPFQSTHLILAALAVIFSLSSCSPVASVKRPKPVEKSHRILAIDTHAHIVRALPSVTKLIPSEARLYHLSVPEKAEFLRREMARAATAYVFLMGIADSPADDALGIKELLEIESLTPGVKLIGAADPRRGKNPAHMHAARTQLEEHRGKIVALKCYLGYLSGPNDPGYHPYYELAREFELPIIFHTGDVWGSKPDLTKSQPIGIDQVAREYPDLRIVMCHVGVPWHIDACEIAWKHDNVWVDLSGLVLGDDADVEQLLDSNTLPDAIPGLVIRDLRNALTFMDKWDRVLYGTDLGAISCSMVNYRRFIERVIPEEHHQKVLQDNAEKLFGVTVHPPTVTPVLERATGPMHCPLHSRP